MCTQHEAGDNFIATFTALFIKPSTNSLNYTYFLGGGGGCGGVLSLYTDFKCL